MISGKQIAAEIALALFALAMLFTVIAPAVFYCGREAVFWWDRQYKLQDERWSATELDPPRPGR